MILYEHFFLIIIVSILGPVVSLLSLVFYQLKEVEVNLLEIENNRILLEKELETSKYNQLSQQIQPHFLFNALNSLLSLLKLKKYEELTNGFEDVVLFLRSKYKMHDNLYPLSEEVLHTRHYLNIQKIRFRDRLRVTFHVEERLLDELTIPFLLQTLVENAFKHGIERVEHEAGITVLIYQLDQFVMLKVMDEGPGFPVEEPIQFGTGLTNIKERLQLIYGHEATLQFGNDERKRAVVTVTWPMGFIE